MSTPLIRGTHVHEWNDEVEISRFSGNPHRKCKVTGCNFITLDWGDDDDDGSMGSCGCIDYHYADCPTRGGVFANDYDPEYEEER